MFAQYTSGRRNPNDQVPKSQGIPKLPNPSEGTSLSLGIGVLVIGVCLAFAIWTLGFSSGVKLRLLPIKMQASFKPPRRCLPATRKRTVNGCHLPVLVGKHDHSSVAQRQSVRSDKPHPTPVNVPGIQPPAGTIRLVAEQTQQGDGPVTFPGNDPPFHHRLPGSVQCGHHQGRLWWNRPKIECFQVLFRK